MEDVGLYARQTDIFNPFNPAHQRPIYAVGAGTIGSWVMFGLGKLGFNNMTWIDDDAVELHNCSNQMFPPSMVGKSKLASMVSLMKSFSLTPPNVSPTKFLSEGGLLPWMENTIMVSCVDNMATRKAMFEIAKMNKAVRHFVDGRMAGQVIIVFVVDMQNAESIAFYETSLHSDDSSHIQNDEVRTASDVPCTARSIVDVAMIISGKMVGAIRKLATDGYNAPHFVFDAKNDILLS